MNENKTIEILFDNFINTEPEGDLAEAMHKIGAAVDAAIETGDTGKAVELTSDLEREVMRFGFYGGFAVAWDLMQSLRKDN